MFAFLSALVKGESLGGGEEDVKLIKAPKENKEVHEDEFKDHRKRELLSPNISSLVLLPLFFLLLVVYLNRKINACQGVSGGEKKNKGTTATFSSGRRRICPDKTSGVSVAPSVNSA